MRGQPAGSVAWLWIPVLLLAVACGSGTTTRPAGPVGTMTPTSGVGAITRQDYEAALARWRAADVREYEIIVSYSKVYSRLSGTWTLHVRGDAIEVVNELHDGTPAVPSPQVGGGQMRFLTVEGMFEQIARLLDAGTTQVGAQSYEVTYRAEFDAVNGYPTLLAIYPAITDNDAITRVRSLRIITAAGARPGE